jgi:hypothetical protein
MLLLKQDHNIGCKYPLLIVCKNRLLEMHFMGAIGKMAKAASSELTEKDLEHLLVTAIHMMITEDPFPCSCCQPEHMKEFISVILERKQKGNKLFTSRHK